MIASRFHHRSLLGRVLPGLILLSLPLAAAAQEAPRWLLLNFMADDSLLVADPHEKGKLLQDGWKVNSEMRVLAESEAGAQALHRMARRGDHRTDRMLSANAGEVSECIKLGYVDEGVLGFVALAQTRPELVPVYRFRKERNNLWLIDKSDQPWAENNGWKLDGVAFWVLPAAKSGP
jgi:hypothetical protein